MHLLTKVVNLGNAEGEQLHIINCLRQALHWCGHDNIPTNMDQILDLAWCEVEIERQREKKDAGIKEPVTDPFNSASTDPFNLAAFSLPDIEPMDMEPIYGSTINEFDLIGSASLPLAPENDDTNIAKEEEEELGRKREWDPDWDLKTVTDYVCLS